MFAFSYVSYRKLLNGLWWGLVLWVCTECVGQFGVECALSVGQFGVVSVHWVCGPIGVVSVHWVWVNLVLWVCTECVGRLVLWVCTECMGQFNFGSTVQWDTHFRVTSHEASSQTAYGIKHCYTTQHTHIYIYIYICFVCVCVCFIYGTFVWNICRCGKELTNFEMSKAGNVLVT